MEALLDSQIALSENGRRYELEGEEYVRVTDVIHATMPPYLAPWAEQVGIKAAHRIYEQEKELPDNWRTTLEMAKQMQIDHEGERNKGASRGLESHLALEAWIKHGHPPDLSDFEPEHRPFAMSLCEFLVDCEPEFESAEVTVWHPELRYAGTFDAIGKITRRPEGARWPEEILGKRFVWDLKTNKERRVYSPQHYMQLAAYRHALDFHGVDVDGEAVIAIGPSPWKTSGKPYTVAPNYFPARLWPPIVAAYNAIEEGKALNPRGRNGK